MAVKNRAALLIGGGDGLVALLGLGGGGDGGIIKSLPGGLAGRGLAADEAPEELRQLQGRSSVSSWPVSSSEVEDVDASAKTLPPSGGGLFHGLFGGFDCVVDNVTCCAAGLTQCLFPARHILLTTFHCMVPRSSALFGCLIQFIFGF